ncbi:hypothetical protein Gotur_001471 [Gossypium turneri]
MRLWEAHITWLQRKIDINYISRVCIQTEQGVAQAIIRFAIDFKKDPWPKVSDNAKDLVKKMLNPDPK